MPLIQRIRLENLLSFGPDMPPLELRDLNVLIGPNGSGKSNFIEAISLLRATSTNLADVVREAGGIYDWIWKGAGRWEIPRISVWMVDGKHLPCPLHHYLEFKEQNQQFYLVDEFVTDFPQHDPRPGHFLYHFGESEGPVIRLPDGDVRQLPSVRTERHRSILAQIRDPDQYPGITYIGDQYSKIKIYRDWTFGRLTPSRLPQKADGRSDYLVPDCSNLGMVLNRIRRDPIQKEQLIERLNDLYPGIKDVDVSIEGGTVQVFLTEGKYAMPATRLSDGTLRYLCLLAILLHPTPPPLICIEEPELGLHPDVMPAIGKLLKDASTRTQLIVTTHSDELIDSLSDSPEDVVVCEKHDGCTTFNRLDADKLKVWLKDYSLGNLWRSGQIGGNRW